MGIITVVASGKGGTGKTTVAAGLASAFALGGKRVCAVDMDAGLANLDLALGIAGAVFGCDEAMNDPAAAEEFALAHPDIPNLFFLAAPGYERQEGERFSALFKALSERFDEVVLDAPAGIGPFFRAAAQSADRALLVSTPDTPCLRDASTAAELLEELGVGDVRLVLNRVSKRLVRKNGSYNIDESMDGLGLRLAGVIFEDSSVRRAAHRCRPLLSAGKKAKGAARAISDIALRLGNCPVEPIL